MSDTVFIHDLQFPAIIGIMDHERLQRQTVSMDIEFTTDISKAAASGNIEDTVSYAEVAERVTELAQNGEYLLVESLAEDSAQLILKSYPAIEQVTIKVAKPDILPNAGAVGVKIERRR